MDVIEIIKDAFVFPSQNIQVLLIFHQKIYKYC